MMAGLCIDGWMDGRRDKKHLQLQKYYRSHDWVNFTLSFLKNIKMYNILINTLKSNMQLFY